MKNILIAVQNYHVALVGQVLSFVVHLFFLILFGVYHVSALYYVNWFSVCLFSGLSIATFLKKRFMLWTVVLLTAEVIGHQIAAVSLLGLSYGFEYLFIPLSAFLALLFSGNFTAALFSFGAASVGMAAAWGLGYALTPSYVMPQEIKVLIHAINLSSAFVITSVITLVFSFLSREFQNQLLMESRTDTLTKVFNRKRASEFLQREFSRYQRENAVFALCIGDIDDFKKINDTYGHQTGDIVLKTIAEKMRQLLRKQDIVARWGGEEFLFIFPDTDLDDGVKAVEKLRAALSDIDFNSSGHRFQVSMTFGVASARQGRDPEKVIKLADDALYVGKGNGKNRVVAAK